MNYGASETKERANYVMGTHFSTQFTCMEPIFLVCTSKRMLGILVSIYYTRRCLRYIQVLQ